MCMYIFISETNSPHLPLKITSICRQLKVKLQSEIHCKHLDWRGLFIAFVAVVVFVILSISHGV